METRACWEKKLLREMLRLRFMTMAVAVLLCFSSSLSAANRGRDNTREALMKLDSGVEAKAEVTGPSEQTKKEVERQKLQREARKKRQKENREKRQKRLDEMNSRIRRKDMKKNMASRFWLILLGVVMLIGCIFAFNDLSIIFVSYFGGYFGMDVDAFVKARRKLTRTNVNSAGVWINALASVARSIIGGGGRGRQGGAVSGSHSSSNLASGAGSANIHLSTAASVGQGASPSAGGGLSAWFGKNKAHFKNSEDPCDHDEETGRRLPVFSPGTR